MSGVGQVLTLGVGEERFAIPVTSVQEILDTRPITRLPDAPSHILGVIDVRGKSVAVLDLGLLLGKGWIEDDESTRIVVLRLPLRGGDAVLALKADRVFEVTELDGDALEPLPEARLLDWNARLVTGLGRKGGGFVALLDVERMLRTEDAGGGFVLAA
ncbi:chemotaxis protein CheW [Acuticoccus kandeliae]|uniref:chemotaxis protein CheW n=1 Tax=Acuticoccus kandeliae TaxID=2073160 RepID=UPI000D3E197E|nr:chemotaxis protein CheW [Acuticoccus kandeliae]